MTHTRARRRAPHRLLLTTGLTLSLSAGLALSALPAQALTAADSEKAATASSRSATWLTAQRGGDQLVHGEYEFPAGTWNAYVDYGLSLDLVYAYRRLGVGASEQAQILDAIANGTDPTSGKPMQDEYTGTGKYAGALGKLTHAVVSAGRDIDAYGDGKLDDELRARVVTAAGPEKGRAKDEVDPTDQFSQDYSNTLGQAFVVRAFAALGKKDSSNLRSTTAFLLQQQCAAGYFREGMNGTDNSCDAAKGSASVDATAQAVRALLAARGAGVQGLDDDLADAAGWLVRRQRLDGSFVGNGVANANSTGLAAYALASTGHAGAAGTAAAWVRAHQVDGLVIKQHPALQGENGAIAYSTADLTEGEKNGIARAARRTWQRAAAEGALALPSLLPAATLPVSAVDRAAGGSKVKVTFRGLRAGEVWKVRAAGTLLAQGRVPASGPAVATVVLPRRKGKLTLVAVGSRESRRGTEVITVR